jgi:SAM-dependent methyltransferase
MQEHWEHVYATKQPEQVSWFRPHLDVSLDLIERALGDRVMASIVDAGGGASTLVDDLLGRGYQNVQVLDISRQALAIAQHRLGARSAAVRWIHGSVTDRWLAPASVELWHDRAVFHFLTRPEDRSAYVERVLEAVVPGGHVIVGSFGPGGPLKCSGLDTVRYEADALHGAFGSAFQLLESRQELHATPSGATQEFLYCFCVRR